MSLTRFTTGFVPLVLTVNDQSSLAVPSIVDGEVEPILASGRASGDDQFADFVGGLAVIERGYRIRAAGCAIAHPELSLGRSLG